ncbi:hypothetical protein H7849_09690 [Alloacidobacterium dinghuense]|uniref:Uncharacterized protein n=1 Tax=Alloacidobacterium dinghuense TaxID=2763107 RepID=A0A7G8BNM1_9BACT|nr:hypothetical protein [Alloacidobacterium dinghuense]QNI34141.1 hypothetical protein H7849_09690 [Alloacidobacterium dinghuense]
MSSVSGSSFSVTSLLDRAIDALARTDTTSLTQVLTDCNCAEMPDSQEEFSRALTQQAAFEKVLELTARNLRLLRGEENSFRYGRGRGRNS